MQGKIAFEEHVAIEETIEATRKFSGESGRWDDHVREILDLGTERLEHMDRSGIEFAILSLNAPGIQGVLDTNEAIALARKGNDKMAAAVSAHPKRYGAFATLPLQDPDAASAELTRCVRELGFKGCMINGFTQRDDPDSALYLDEPRYRDFWATLSELNVPLYLHPRMQIPARAQNYAGHPWLMSAPWGFAVETSIHALRICGSGIFDDYPNLKVIIGHLGEFIPHGLWRIDARMEYSPRGYRGERPLGDYFQEHFFVTTSGFFNDPAFRNTLEVMGTDKVFFCADYPFERMEDAAEWFDSSGVVSDEERIKIGRTNAMEYFNLQLE
ncbi:MAG: putative TIM-barrel fold metal-dependent hydrolase [Woeseiaceae bacterium]|jgi:predicted TIM-barrel fold metal-dependent hydrolase